MNSKKMPFNKEVFHPKDVSAKEEETVNYILSMEKEFREYYELLSKEMKVQRELVERMWFLSQRYTLLVSTGPCCKLIDIYPTPSDDVILQEYHDKLQQVRVSICHLWQALRKLRVTHLHFKNLCSELDMSRDSSLIMGDPFHKSISYFIELIDDLFKYFHSLVLNFKIHAHQMDPADPIQLEEYKKILEPSEDFDEYLKQGLVYCKCLRPKPVCNLKSVC